MYVLTSVDFGRWACWSSTTKRTLSLKALLLVLLLFTHYHTSADFVEQAEKITLLDLPTQVLKTWESSLVLSTPQQSVSQAFWLSFQNRFCVHPLSSISRATTLASWTLLKKPLEDCSAATSPPSKMSP